MTVNSRWNDANKLEENGTAPLKCWMRKPQPRILFLAKIYCKIMTSSAIKCWKQVSPAHYGTWRKSSRQKKYGCPRRSEGHRECTRVSKCRDILFLLFKSFGQMTWCLKEINKKHCEIYNLHRNVGQQQHKSQAGRQNGTADDSHTTRGMEWHRLRADHGKLNVCDTRPK